MKQLPVTIPISTCTKILCADLYTITPKFLSTYSNKAHDTEAQSINVDKDLMTTFEEFKVKVELTTDEVIKFFLSLNVLPGQHVIAVDGDIVKMFDDLKEKLSLSSSQTMKFLFDLYEGYVYVVC